MDASESLDKSQKILRNAEDHGLAVCWRHVVPILYENPPIQGGKRPMCPACSHIIKFINEVDKIDREKKTVLDEMRSFRIKEKIE